MAGRRPKPTAVKKLAGNPGKRPLPKNEPQPKRGLPARPKHLTREAGVEFTRLAAELDQLGLLAKIDLTSFVIYCETFATWIRAKRKIAKHGFTYKAAGGIIRKRPEVSIMEQAARTVRQFAIEFGLTPSSRTRVAAGMAGLQRPLPGAAAWPEHRDPDRPAEPAMPGEFTDEEYFDRRLQ